MTAHEHRGHRGRRAARSAAGLAAALWLGAGPGLAAADGPPCQLRLRAEPDRLEAGAPRVVAVQVDGAGTPRPRLAASAGRLGPPAPGPAADGPGLIATWQAPEAGVPRVAVLGAVAADGACGYVAVPLHGLGDAEVRTRPGASVQVRIAERTFGPATADATGLALVPVEVPPGVDAVFHGTRRIPLPLPPVAHAALFLAEAEAPADREATVAGLLVAVAPDGAPLDGPPPALAASDGTLEAPAPAGPGAWRLRWHLPAGRAGEATLTAQRPGEPAVRVLLARPAGPAAVVKVALDRGRAMAGQSRPVTAAVTLLDAAGNPAAGAVEAEPEAGRVAAPERTGPGAWALRWTVPDRLEGRKAAALTVRSGAASGSASLALAPAGPARLDLAPAAPLVTADGAAEVDLVATVADAHGNPVDEPPAIRSAGAGTVGPPRQAGPGRFAMAYRPRVAAAPGEDEVRVELPPLSARARPRLRPPLPPLTLSAGAGAALASGRGAGLAAVAGVGAWRWLGRQEAGLALSAGFTRLRRESEVVAPGGPVAFTGELRSLALLLSAGWRRSAGQRLAVRLEAGAGVARVESLVAAGGGPLLPEAGWAPAAGAAAALGWRLGPGRAALEARATWLGDPGLASLQRPPAPLSLTLGYELDAP